jgi:hypothetical protein
MCSRAALADHSRSLTGCRRWEEDQLFELEPGEVTAGRVLGEKSSPRPPGRDPAGRQAARARTQKWSSEGLEPRGGEAPWMSSVLKLAYWPTPEGAHAPGEGNACGGAQGLHAMGRGKDPCCWRGAPRRPAGAQGGRRRGKPAGDLWRHGQLRELGRRLGRPRAGHWEGRGRRPRREQGREGATEVAMGAPLLLRGIKEEEAECAGL